MNRRSFMGILAAFPAGVCAAFAKSKEKVKWLSPGGVVPHRRGSKFVCKPFCSCNEQRCVAMGDKFLIACPHTAPYFVNPYNNTIEFLDFNEEGFVSGFASPVKDVCSYHDDLYILLENGELWNVSNGDEKKLVRFDFL